MNMQAISQEYVMGKFSDCKDLAVKNKPQNVINFIVWAYLGRMVMLIEQYQAQNVVDGPAISQFLDFASYVKLKTGNDVADKIFEKLQIEVENNLDLVSEGISEFERKQVSQIVALMVPLNDMTALNHNVAFALD